MTMKPIRTFVWCHDSDDGHREELDRHLTSAKAAGLLDVRQHDRFGAGRSTADEIADAGIIVLLLTSRLLAELHQSEVAAQPFQRVGDAICTGARPVVPVLLKHVNLEGTLFEGVRCIPSVGNVARPVVGWRHRSEAWYEVAQLIQAVAKSVVNGNRNLVPRMEGSVRTRTESRERGKNRRRSAAVEFAAQGRYRLLDDPWPGRGMETWRAVDETDGHDVLFHALTRPVAAKQALLPEVFDRVREMGNLDHPGIARVREADGWDGERHQRFFVTDPAASTRLQQLVLEGRRLPHRGRVRERLGVEATLSMVMRLGEALDYVHRQEMQHGAVDPMNIWCGDDGTLTLNGFDPLIGFADVRPPESAYLAPELRRRARRVDFDPRIDVYGLAMTAIYMLRRDELPKDALKSPHKIVDELLVTDALKRVLKQGAETDPKRRCDTVAAFITALGKAYLAGRERTLVELVPIPGGEFMMGNDADVISRPHEKPARRVRVSDFQMAKCAVTQKLYRDLMATNPSRPPHGDDLPVNRVRFRDAIEFCNRLSMLEGYSPCYRLEGDAIDWDVTADGYRLPTEAEWEYAARGSDGRRFPWGDEDIAKQACWNGAGNDLGQGNRRGPCPVDGYPSGASPFGLLQMVGNVWEWCWDRYEPYEVKRDGAVDPVGPSVGHIPPGAPYDRTYRVLRGGSWNETQLLWMRATSRSTDREQVDDEDIGFRVVRGPRRAPPTASER